MEAPLKTKNSYRNIAIGADAIEVLRGMDQTTEIQRTSVVLSIAGKKMQPKSLALQ